MTGYSRTQYDTVLPWGTYRKGARETGALEHGAHLQAYEYAVYTRWHHVHEDNTRTGGTIGGFSTIAFGCLFFGSKFGTWPSEANMCFANALDTRKT